MPLYLRYNLVPKLPDIYLSPFSEKIGVTWKNGMVWDKVLIQKFYSLLPKNDFFVVLDLGAQTGSFTLLSKFFPNSVWHAFEPIKEAADTLKENIKINNIENVSVYEVAASNTSSTAILNMPKINSWGLATLGSNPLRFKPYKTRKIKCIKLDTFIKTNHIKKVHFMKIDTEGFELFILQGAKKMIQRDHPIILMEYNMINMKQCNVLKEDVNKFLTQLGYEWKPVTCEDILCTPKNLKFNESL